MCFLVHGMKLLKHHNCKRFLRNTKLELMLSYSKKLIDVEFVMQQNLLEEH